MLKSTAVSNSNDQDIENNFIIDKWMKRSVMNDSTTIGSESTKGEDKQHFIMATNDIVNNITKGNIDPTKARILKIEKVPMHILSESAKRGIKRPKDIEISFYSNPKISRLSLPANMESTSTVANTPTKSDPNTQIKRASQSLSKVTYSRIITVGGSANSAVTAKKPDEQKVLKKKSNSPNAGAARNLGNSSTKVSPKKGSIPLKLEQMFKKKPSSSKKDVLDNKSSPVLKPKKSNKKKLNISYVIEPTDPLSLNPYGSIFANKTSNTNAKTIINQESSSSSGTNPLKSPTKEVVRVAETESDVVNKNSTPGIPSFSVSSSSISIGSSKDFTGNTGEKSPTKNISPARAKRLCNLNKNGRQELDKDIKGNAYTDLIDTYRYLVTPKSWSVMEMSAEKKEQLIVFYKTSVMKEKGVYVSVMKKSLIIDKDSKMHYSVHGLPVDLKTTILPKVLDSTKKLLSILHIFDKMQICTGVGDDLDIIQDEVIFKDTCRFWRHKDCKMILMKTMRCPVCTEIRDILLESES